MCSHEIVESDRHIWSKRRSHIFRNIRFIFCFSCRRIFVFTDLKKLAQAVANQIPTNVRLATVAHSKAYRRIRRVRGARL